MARRRTGHYSRTLVVKPESGTERDLYLELGLPMLDDIGVKMNSHLNRIELELLGEYEEVDRLISKLRHLEDMIYVALNPDGEGLYRYHANLLNKKFKPPVNLELYASCLAVFGYRARSETNNLLTDAELSELDRIHDRIIELRQQIEYDLNRDIERFVITLAIELNITDLNLIAERAVELGLVQDSKYGLQFNIAPAEARLQLLEVLGIEVEQAVEFDEDEYPEMTLDDFMFDGGRVVFVKDGQEVDGDDLSFADSDTEKT